jgi:hypothetical protein
LAADDVRVVPLLVTVLVAMASPFSAHSLGPSAGSVGPRARNGMTAAGVRLTRGPKLASDPEPRGAARWRHCVTVLEGSRRDVRVPGEKTSAGRRAAP